MGTFIRWALTAFLLYKIYHGSAAALTTYLGLQAVGNEVIAIAMVRLRRAFLERTQVTKR